VSDQLGIDADRIDVVMGDTDRTPSGLTGVRTLYGGRRFRPHHQPATARRPGSWRRRARDRPSTARHGNYDTESGQLLSGSFMDYAMPRASDVPSFDFSTHNVPTRANPLGVKGAGEAGAVGAPPAVMNAIVDAIADRVRARHIDMPATPGRIWEALNGGPRRGERRVGIAPTFAPSPRLRGEGRDEGALPLGSD
jgi:CO/xanthine dehydrogenase Mo-binding subunit